MTYLGQSMGLQAGMQIFQTGANLIGQIQQAKHAKKMAHIEEARIAAQLKAAMGSSKAAALQSSLALAQEETRQLDLKLQQLAMLQSAQPQGSLQLNQQTMMLIGGALLLIILLR